MKIFMRATVDTDKRRMSLFLPKPSVVNDNVTLRQAIVHVFVRPVLEFYQDDAVVLALVTPEHTNIDPPRGIRKFIFNDEGVALKFRTLEGVLEEV
jgi:hypothetical protein